MASPDKLLERIPFFKRRPALTAILLLLAGVLTFSILNLDDILKFKVWMSDKDVVVLVRSSEVTPSEFFTTGYTHTIEFQVLNSRDMPLLLERVQVINPKTKELIRGYKYQPQNNEPVKPGESRLFKTTNILLNERPGLGKNDQITQALQVVTSFKTYTVPIRNYAHSFK